MHREHHPQSHDEHSHDHDHEHDHAIHHDPPHSHSHEVRTRRGWGRVIALLVLLLAVVGVYRSVVFVNETELVLLETFGRIVSVYDQAGDPENSTAASDRGLYFKWPWQSVRRFDRRLQLFDPPAREMLTHDRKNITIDAYICWKIADAPRTSGEVSFDERPVVRFLRTVGGVAGAQARLDEMVRSLLASEVAAVELSDLVSAAEDRHVVEESAIERLGQRVTQAVSTRAGADGEASASRFGIQVVDVRLKRFNLPEENRSAVYNRMRSERRRIAVGYRSEGEAKARITRSQAEKEREQILARAYAESERIRGEGEAEATAIYSAAHSQDPEFYQLLRTLDAYKRILNDKTTLVLSAGSNMLKLLSTGVPSPPPAPSNSLPSAASQVAGEGQSQASESGGPQ